MVAEFNWETAANIATAVSLPLGIIGLIFVFCQLRQQKRSASFEGNFSVLQKITDQYDKLYHSSQDETLLRREIVNLLALFEYVAGALNKGALDRKLCSLVEDHVIDIIKRMVKSDYYVGVIKSSKFDDNTYKEVKTLIRNNRSKFADFDVLREAFGYEKTYPWMW
ncbi:hypothetical protein FLX56_13610 [Synechococcus moorigangaii CMS01]|nr:hypothetical protein [Synechococcus moorigangaii CMS01]